MRKISWSIFNCLIICNFCLFPAVRADITHLPGKTIYSLSEAERHELDAEIALERSQKMQASVITFDTNNIEACEKFHTYLRFIKQHEVTTDTNANPNIKQYDPNICKSTGKDEAISIILIKNEDSVLRGYRGTEVNVPFKKFVVEPNNNKYHNLLVDTIYMGVIGLSSVAVMNQLPRSFTKWSDEQIGWRKNVSRSPVIDKDSPLVNYVGHPYAGSFYYFIARHNGFNRLASVGYSIFMSTFFWEYGVEAWFERPSVQDLIVTPLVGSLLGMLFEVAIERIEENDNQILGSQTLGKIAILLMDPMNPVLRESKDLVAFLANHGLQLKLVLADRSMTTNHAERFGNSYQISQFGWASGLFLVYHF